MAIVNKASLIAALLIILFVTSSNAQNPPRLDVSPALPQAGEPIDAVVLLFSEPQGFCIDPIPNVQGQEYDVTIEDSLVILDLSVAIINPSCAPFLPGTPNFFPLSELPAGEYRLQLNTVASTTPFPATADDRFLRDEIEFEVVPATTAVPINSTIWLIMLIISILVFSTLHTKLFLVKSNV